MHFRKIRASRPPILFELQVNASLAYLSRIQYSALPPAHLMPRMRDYVESLLLANIQSPTPRHVAMLLDRFDQLVQLSNNGKPFIYKKTNTLSLLFDVSAIQSEMSVESPEELVLGYTHTMMGFLLFNPEPARIAMIGLGGGSLPKYCYRHLPGASVIVAENDAEVIALRDCFCVPQDDERFQVLCTDGADFVAQASDQFDVLIVDGFDRSGQPAQLCSQRFYDDCRNALAPNGIMVVNLLGDLVETEAYLDRISMCFDGAVVVIDALDALNKIVFACKGDALALSDRALLERLKNLEDLHVVSLSQTVQSILQERRAKAAAA